MLRIGLYGFLSLWLLTSSAANGQPTLTIDYRVGIDPRLAERHVVERSLDGGINWQTVDITSLDSVNWLLWDPQAPEHVCYHTWYQLWSISSQTVHCSWNAGASWFTYRIPVGRGESLVPPFASELRLDPKNSEILLLTAYDRIYRLSRLTDDVLPGTADAMELQTVGMIPLPPACAGLAADQLCANLALAGYPAVWFDPEQSGQGITLVARQGQFWGYFTVYDEFGDAHWYLFQFSLPDGMPEASALVDLMAFSGPPLGTSWDPALVQGHVIGQATLIFGGPKQMTFRTELPGREISLHLVPFQ